MSPTTDSPDPDQSSPPVDEVVDDAAVRPGEGLYTPTQTDPKPAPNPGRIRWWVAIVLLLVMCVTVGGGLVGWLEGHNLSEWTGFTTPVFTLAGVAVAFYFSDRRPGSK